MSLNNSIKKNHKLNFYRVEKKINNTFDITGVTLINTARSS